MTKAGKGELSWLRFQLTRSRGAWQVLTRHWKKRTKFQLTRSRGAWHSSHQRLQAYCTFQLTRSRGAWRALHLILSHNSMISTHTLTWSVTCWNFGRVERLDNFNSHAHVERDPITNKFTANTKISTHTLTWSVTYAFILSYKATSISTHTLTWSVTMVQSQCHLISLISTHTLTWSVTTFDDLEV